MELRRVAEIHAGLAFRSRIESEPQGPFIVVQARDLGRAGRVQLEMAARLTAIPTTPAGGYLQPGDVVFQARGTRFPAAVFESTRAGAIAAAPLWVLRVDRNRLIPDFLAAVLASPGTQASLRHVARGTHVPQLPRRAIEELEVELPDLECQARLVELAHLQRRERELTERLQHVRGHLFDLAVREAARQSEGGAAARA